MYYLKSIWLKARYSGLARLISDGLLRVGIRITPYYLILEGLSDTNLQHLETGFDQFEIGFLGPQDMKAISAIPGRTLSEDNLLLRLREGKKCFGVKRYGELVAFTWCDFDECDFKGRRFSLKKNEAFLFDAYTLIPFRGRGIAPYMRYNLYKELGTLGKDRLYSITEYFNKPSLRFKKKLHARLLELGLYIELFGKWRFSSRVREYAPQD